jgi:soluble cytochrome b562
MPLLSQCRRMGEPVRDDLIEGQEVLRLDDLERLEMMAVQLDEASAFLAEGSVSHARLAFILLDNAAEVIMRRNVEVHLTHNKAMERVLRQWKEILERDPADAEARRHHDEVAREVVPRSARKTLAWSFDPKVDFIRDRGDIQETESRVLKKLHRYRNELYHRDRVRPAAFPCGSTRA